MDRGQLLGLAHIGLFVTDIEKSKAFYTGILGFEVYHECVVPSEYGDVFVAFARLNDCVLEMVQPAAGAKRADGFVDHIALKAENIEWVRDMLAEKGIVFETDEIVYAPGVFPPKGSKWILFRGPDGEHLEINEAS